MLFTFELTATGGFSLVVLSADSLSTLVEGVDGRAGEGGPRPYSGAGDFFCRCGG